MHAINHLGKIMKPSEFNKLIKPVIEWYGENDVLEEIKRVMNFQGYSLWWSSRPIKKDIYMDNEWFVDLIKRVFGKKIQKSMGYENKKRSIFFILYLFFFDLYRCILFKFLLKKQHYNSNDVFFHSFELNVKSNEHSIVDRHLGKVPELSKQYNLNHTFLLSLSKRKILNPINLKRKINNYKKLKQNIIFLDRYITLKDIILIHCLCK